MASLAGEAAPGVRLIGVAVVASAAQEAREPLPGRARGRAQAQEGK